MAHEAPSSYQNFSDYVLYCHDLGFPLGQLNYTYDRLAAPDSPAHWEGVFDPQADLINIPKLNEALDITFQRGQLPRPRGAYRYYDAPGKLSVTSLTSLTLLAHVHMDAEQLPDPRVEDKTYHTVPKKSPKSAINGYDIFAYADQLRYRRHLFIDHHMINIHQAWMQQRLPEMPMQGQYTYDYDAISVGAIYPVLNGVAFKGYGEERPRPINCYALDKDLLPLSDEYSEENDEYIPRRYMGLTPAALAADTYQNVYHITQSLNPSTFGALLKYIKALRQAGLHTESMPKINNNEPM